MQDIDFSTKSLCQLVANITNLTVSMCYLLKLSYSHTATVNCIFYITFDILHVCGICKNTA
jgi:hypothetical protein